MIKPIIFLGPSLDLSKARAILDADYRPPAKKGDFIGIASSFTESVIIGFIDGVFLQDYPPTPIEVHQVVVRSNMHVIGAASLGALRAVELEKFGMHGLGTVFNLYKSGRLQADDEVAVTFTEGDNKLQSEAMIDIRYNLFLARKKGIISNETKNAITKIAKSTYFPFRNYIDILEIAKRRFPLLDDIETLEEYLKTSRRSIKEKDAMQLLDYIKHNMEKLKT